MAAKKTKSKSAKSSKTTKSFEQAFANGKNQFETAGKGFEKAMRSQAEKAGAALYQGYEEINSLGKESLDAFVESGSLLAQGCEEINRAVIGYAQQSLESGVSTYKSLMDCKSIEDVIELQTSFAKNFFENVMTEGSRISEMSLRVANEAFEPIRDRATATVDKIIKSTAA